MLTAFSEESYKERARQIGACGYVVKPIDKDTLLPQLTVLLLSLERLSRAGRRRWERASVACFREAGYRGLS
jgi:AmiR/NasT family two-component response regulator